MPWVLDLDGVVRLGAEPIPGAADAVALLRRAGEDVVFATNNSAAPVRVQEERLEAMGIPARGAVVSSAQGAASLVGEGERVLLIGEAGLREEVEARGAELVDDGPCDVVVSGLDRRLDYAALRRAGRAIHGGARWVHTNSDPTYPTTDGLDPGAGTIGAAIAAVGGVEAEMGGKPDGAMVGLLRERLGDEGTVVGDRADTDGLLAHELGYRFGLVLTGVTTEMDLPVVPSPWRVAPDLLGLVRSTLGDSDHEVSDTS